MLLRVIALELARHVLLLADPHQLANGRAQFGFSFWTSTLPALAAIPLIIVFRAPRNIVEVAVVPAVVTIVGVSWMQAGAWLQAPCVFRSQLNTDSGGTRAPIPMRLER